MARPTKAEQAAKEAQKQKDTVTPKPQPFKEGAKVPTGKQAIIQGAEEAIKVTSSSDLAAIDKLNQLEKLETEKLAKIVIPDDLPPVPGRPSGKIGAGMVRYWDSSLNKYGTEKESVLKAMIRFNPKRFKKIV